jgi:cytochrome c peroxidase
VRRFRPALLLVALIVLIAAPLARLAHSPKSPSAVALLQSRYRQDLARLEESVGLLSVLPADAAASSFQSAFRRARSDYKQVEYLVEYYSPTSAIALNGAPLPRIDDDDPLTPIPATGFQVIEAALFPSPMPGFVTRVRAQTSAMAPILARLREGGIDTAAGDGGAFDAMRLELGRIGALGLAGFDATTTQDGIREAAAALRGVRSGLLAYAPAVANPKSEAWDRLQRLLDLASARLEADPRFEEFDRLSFITGYANPLARALAEVQQTLRIPASDRRSAWSGTTGLFGRHAFDPYFFAPPETPPPRGDLVALGRELFFDPSLSRERSRSCATCHQPARAFTDGLARPRVDPGNGRVRNTPTLLNAALQPTLFGDGRARYLEDQIEQVLANPREMNLPLPLAASRLRERPELVARFASAFDRPPDEALNESRVQVALASFVRSLPGMTSRFDRAVEGDTAALSPAERRGFNLFMGKAACGTCHFAPLFGGALPPVYRESEPEVIGVPARPGTKGAVIDPDPGTFDVDHTPQHRHAFKTPSLRNVALTAPYMHNGVYRTLEEAVDFYDRGGGIGLGMTLPNQTLSPEPLHLSREEKRDLVAFLRSLTDSVVSSPPAIAP